MTAPRCILHIGAPKCGSSALQAALTAVPDHKSSTGQRYRYVGTGTAEGRIYPLYGGVVRRLGRSSEFGYSCWPNLRAQGLPQSGRDDPVWDALERVMQTATRHGHVPILSNEGWLGAAAAFGASFLAQPGRRADVVAFVRPPLEWMNAAYWQWGVWTGYGFRDWLRLSGMRYALGAQLAQWAALKAVTLHVGPSGQDVVAGFGQRFGLDLRPGQKPGQAVNSAASPAFIGLQLRHRKFRRDGHDSAVEFVLQRWCGRYTARKPWAIAADDIAALQTESAPDVAALLGACGPDDAQALLQDPRWLSPEPYHRMAAPTGLDDREGLAELLRALLAGVQAAHARARLKPPALPGAPAISADVQTWDAALVPALDALITADVHLRNRLVFWRSKARDLAEVCQRLRAGLRG